MRRIIPALLALTLTLAACGAPSAEVTPSTSPEPTPVESAEPVGAYRYCLLYTSIPEGPAVVCGNHSNLVDPLLAAAAFGKRTFMHFIAKVELSTVPVIGWVLRKCGVCFVNRGESDIGAMRSMMRYLKRGDKIFIFPEGTRAGEDNMVDAKTGAVRLASKLQVPDVYKRQA